MRFRAYDIWFICMGIGVLYSVFINPVRDNLLSNIISGVAPVFSIGGIILGAYYVIVYFYRKKKTSKSYI